MQSWQIREELSEEQRNIPLAKFDGGTVTIKDLLLQIHGITPNKRPRNLNTMQGIDELLDKTAPMRLWVSEAKRFGFHKKAEYIRTARDREDKYLFSMVRREVVMPVAEATDAEVREYFEQNKEDFRKKDSLKIDQIWCEDLETANKVRAELDGGKDFATTREQYSLKKRQRPIRASVESDGVFLTELWAAEPNDIVGPLKGFYPVIDRQRLQTRWEIKWRVVKILEKELGAPRDFSKSASGVEGVIKRQRRKAALDTRRNELLQKHKYTLYLDRVKGIDPFEIP